MSLINDLIPLNFVEEKNKFLETQDFNPQFVYQRSFSKKELGKYGLAKKEYLELARKIIAKSLDKNTPKDLLDKKGRILTKEEVEAEILKFLQAHDIEKRYSIIWSETFTSRTTVNSRQIKLRLPCSIREEDLSGLIYHELGTHVLRRINNEKQAWYKNKKKFDLQEHLFTEEGLAVTHSLIPKKNKLAYTAALHYWATDLAQNQSFLELFNFLKPYTPNPEKAFSITFRKKRGLTDTSQPEIGLTKDLVYFEGFVDTIKFLIEKNFPLEELYYGRIAYQDIMKVVSINPTFKPVMPSFYTDDPIQYKNNVKKIAELNGITTQI